MTAAGLNRFSEKTEMTVSVLICTYQRPELLSRNLEALVIGSEEKPDQIIVVNGGDERSDRVVEDFVTKGRQRLIQVKLVKTVNKCLAVSRNVGLAHCDGDIVAMTDDDAQVYPDWIKKIKYLHQIHPQAGAIGGAVIGEKTNSLASRISDRITFPQPDQATLVRNLPGVNVSYKRSVIDNVGLQDEQFSLSCGEDVDYNWRVKLSGYDVRFDPTIVVTHYHRDTVRGLWRQLHNYGRSYYLVRSKWKDMYCVYPHGVRSLKDIAKALNFVAAVFYLPVLEARKMERVTDKVLAVPVLIMLECAWRGGMIRQRILSH